MDIDYLNKLIANPAISNTDDVSELKDLADKYPFCQFIHIMIAIIHRDHNLEDKDKYLSRAALRTPDRKVLKKIIEHQIDLTSQPPVEAKDSEDQPVASIEESKFEESKEEPTIESSEETSNDNQYSSEIPESEIPEIVANQNQVEEPDNEVVEKVSNLEEQHEQPPVEKKGFIEELSQEVMSNLEKVQKVMFKYTEKEKEFEKYLENLKAQKEESSRNFDVILNYLNEVEPESKAQKLESKEQLELIDRFIAAEPNLQKRPRPQDATEESQEDLSEGSTKIDENLVSENLALIMKKQGKVDKAIDIYKKLIWKFPQKKTYFASQIDELEKN